MRITKTHRTALLVMAIALSAVQTGLAQDNTKQRDLPNFYRINEGLYRGGQPTEDGFKRLAAMHIKTVVNLRDDDERAHTEGAEARAAGLQYFNLPLAHFNGPDEDRVAQILSIINAPQNQPVFVHCKRGADRTGTIIAVYRIDHDGWTAEEAKDEAKQFGLGFWQVRMKDYITHYYRRKHEHVGAARPRKAERQ